MNVRRGAIAYAVIGLLVLAVVGARAAGLTSLRSLHLGASEQSCGRVSTGPQGAPMPDDATVSPASCFVEAYAACTPATLTTVEGGTDMSRTRHWRVIRTDTGCRVTGKGTNNGNGMSFDLGTLACERASRSATALTMDGCDGDGVWSIPVVPPRAAVRSSASYATDNPGSADQIG